MSNPWIPAPATAPEPDPAAAPAVSLRPVLAPQRGVPAPREGLPAIPVPASDALWWVGAHGGAGVTTLTHLVHGTVSAGRAWPDPVGGIAPCVLVARSSMSGLHAAQTAMTQWAAGAAPAGVRLLGLVVIADCDRKQPKPLQQFTQVIAGGVPQVWHLRWSEPWRTQLVPSLDGAPRAVVSTVQHLVDLTTSLAATAGGPTERNYR